MGRSIIFTEHYRGNTNMALDARGHFYATGKYDEDVAGSKALPRQTQSREQEFYTMPQDVQKRFNDVFGGDAASNWAAQHYSGSSGGGGEEGGGGEGQTVGEDLSIYDPIFQAIQNALSGKQFDESRFKQKINRKEDLINTQAAATNKATIENMSGRGMLRSGQTIEGLKNNATSQEADTLSALETLANDEKEYLENIRQRGVTSATSLFTTQVNARTEQAIAEMNRKFQEELLASQLAFSEQQNALDRALEREKISAMGKYGSSSTMNFFSGMLSGGTTGYNIGSLFR